MKTQTAPVLRRSRKREAGVAAIELAILMPIMLVFLTLPVFYARCFWHYTVAQKAAQDAARYLSTVPQSEMRTPELAEAAGNLAIEIAERELAELAPGSDIRSPYAYCGTDNCGGLRRGELPGTVRVKLTFSMSDPSGLIDLGWMGAEITASYTMPYVGN